MSQNFKSRGKVTQKLTRDGLIEHNAATGVDVSISKRSEDFDLRGDTKSLPQTKRPCYDRKPLRDNHDTIRQAQKSKSPGSKPARYQPNTEHITGTSADALALKTAPPLPSSVPESQPQTAQLTFETDAPNPTDGAEPETSSGDSAFREDKTSNPLFDSEEHTQIPKLRKSAGLSAKTGTDDNSCEPLSEDNNTSPHTENKLIFPEDEAVSPKLDKAQKQADRAAAKLENAKAKLPIKKKLRVERVFNEETGKPKRRLYFESEVKTQGEHLKGSLRPVKAAGNTALAFGHRKMFQVERENAAVEAAHKGEMTAEGIVRSALRSHKLSPYRKTAKLERTAAKKSVGLAYQKALAQNPKLQSNIISRAFQKRKIKKNYAKAQKAAQRAKNAGGAIGAIVGAAKRHPTAAAAVVLIGLTLFALMSLISAFGGAGGGGVGGVAAATYLAQDVDILGAEAAYAGMETELQYELDNYAALHPGNDEYNFDLDTIWHDPYALISIVSSLHEGEWTVDGVGGTLEMLFEKQYILTETVTEEVRYSTEITETIDPVTGESVETETQVPYDYYICTVTLENFNLSHVPIYIMSEEQLGRYSLYTSTLGNRPDLFSSHPYASVYTDYGRYDIPPEYFEDETFAAIITEAEKYLGYPYVWGGYNPTTSFDCSGFVSWVLNNSGWNIGRLDAQGLYNISAPVPEPKPGDLVFFTGTYDIQGMSHVGIYAGGGMMLHCGNPIGYTSIETTYWQTHIHGFGRIY